MDDIDREDKVYLRLAALGMSLMRSGKKPGTKEPAYRIVSTPRMTLAEVETFVEEQTLLSRVARFRHRLHS